MVSEEEVMRHVGGRTLDRDQAWRSIGYVLGHWRIRGYGLWAVEERSSGDLIGRIGLYRPEGWPGLEVGWLVARERWGEGFATEGAAAAVRYGFETVGEDQLISVIMPANLASIRVAEKLGEHFDRPSHIQGHEVHIYAVDRGHWKADGR
jgi:RimJ/RimL family protein N-acetyltransferase